LCGNDTPLLESSVEQLEIWLLEQALCWSLWVRRVGNDDIECVFEILQILETISNVNFHLGVLEANGHSGEVFLGETDDSLHIRSAHGARHEAIQTDLVNVAQGGLLNTVVLDDLTQNTSITTTNDQDLLGVWVRVHCQVGDHLLVCELVTLSALDDIVKDQDGSVVGGFEDQDILVFALLVVDDVLDLQRHSLTGPHVRDLAEPAIYDKGVSLVLKFSSV